MKAVYKLAVPVLACTLALTACGSDKSGSSDEEKLSKDTKATLSMAIWDKAQLPVVQETIKLFNKEYPNIKIDVSVTAYKEYWTKMRTAAEGKNLPDIFWMNGPNIELYANNNQLADLSNLVKDKQLDMKNYPEGLQELYTVNDKVYGVPKDYDTIGIFYNRDLFKKAGIAEPKADWNWEDYKAVCKELKEKLPGIWPMTAPYVGDGQQTFYNTVAQAGGYIIKDGKSGFADPKTIKGVQFWSDLVKDGYLPESKLQTDPSAKTLFENEKSAMFWTGSWDYNTFLTDGFDVKKLSVAPLPMDEKKASTIHGLAWVVAETSQHKAAAKAFAAFAGTKEAQELQAKSGAVIPAYKGTAEQWAAAAPESVNLKVFLEAADNYSVAYPVSKNTAAWNAKLDEILVPAIDKGANMTDACKEMAKVMDTLLSKEK